MFPRSRPLLLAQTLLLLLSARAQLIEPGICPFGTPQSDWSESRFVADPWYEIKAFALSGLHDGSPSPACTKWHFSPSQDGQGLHAHLKYISGNRDAGVGAFAQYAGREKGPRFNLTIHRTGRSPLSVDMKIIATDYTDFALLWGCSEPNLFERKVVSWVLSKQPELSAAAHERLERLFRRHDIHAEKLVHTDHQSCSKGAPQSRARAAEDFADFQEVYEGVPRGSMFSVSGNLEDIEDESFVEEDEATSLSRGLVEDMLSARLPLLFALLSFAGVSLLVSLTVFSALIQRKALGKTPVLPVRRQDIAVAKLGKGFVDYSRFGRLGQGLVQTRKSGAGALLRLPS